MSIASNGYCDAMLLYKTSRSSALRNCITDNRQLSGRLVIPRSGWAIGTSGGDFCWDPTVSPESWAYDALVDALRG
jgi:hypothetical protein